LISAHLNCDYGFSTRAHNLPERRLHERPQAIAKRDDRNLPTFEVQLVTHILIFCEQHIKPSFFRHTQQIPIGA
jgi:hypothetical protein